MFFFLKYFRKSQMKRDPGENQFLEQIFLLSEQWEAGWGWEPGVNWTCSSILHCPPLVMIINLSWETPSSVLLFVTQPNNKHFLQTLTWNKYIHLSLLLSTQYKHSNILLWRQNIFHNIFVAASEVWILQISWTRKSPFIKKRENNWEDATACKNLHQNCKIKGCRWIDKRRLAAGRVVSCF